MLVFLLVQSSVEQTAVHTGGKSAELANFFLETPKKLFKPGHFTHLLFLILQQLQEAVILAQLLSFFLQKSSILPLSHFKLILEHLGTFYFLEKKTCS